MRKASKKAKSSTRSATATFGPDTPQNQLEFHHALQTVAQGSIELKRNAGAKMPENLKNAPSLFKRYLNWFEKPRNRALLTGGEATAQTTGNRRKNAKTAAAGASPP